MAENRIKCVGILTSGGDCPGLNAAIRGVAKSCQMNRIKVLGVYDGFRGLVENRVVALGDKAVSGILTLGGTLLGTSRDKPHKMPMGGTVMDMTDVAIANARKQQMDCLVCLGGNGTQKNALRLMNAGGLRVLTLPKTIDNDVALTDTTFGFDTALTIATEAIDRLHTTATSHHRIIICEIMGHKAGWLALGAGLAGGADVILIPEIPYSLKAVADHVVHRRQMGKRFSIIAVAEGALSREDALIVDIAKEKKLKDKKEGKKKDKKVAEDGLLDQDSGLVAESRVQRFARELQQITGIDTRVTSLGHVQRGGTPSATDRLLCTRLGTKAGALLAQGITNVMVAVKGDDCVPVALEKVAGLTKVIPDGHPWLESALQVDTCIGKEHTGSQK